MLICMQFSHLFVLFQSTKRAVKTSQKSVHKLTHAKSLVLEANLPIASSSASAAAVPLRHAWQWSVALSEIEDSLRDSKHVRRVQVAPWLLLVAWLILTANCAQPETQTFAKTTAAKRTTAAKTKQVTQM